MCILCAVQRCSRRIAAMLPWLVIPMVLLWFLSQFLPPNFRFEVTIPRVACVSVLAIALLWYEFLMPQISIWRARRSARIREERINQAIELQKLKKIATRRCRNCLTPYREQNPSGRRFLCSYCGHVSKRPVLDLPEWNYYPSGYWLPQGRHNEDMRCLAMKSYSGVLVFLFRTMGLAFFFIRRVFSKVLRLGLREGDQVNGESNGDSKRGDNGGGFQESRVEKARRKAEEKRQARLEREMLEEEERKQREEVARLVEERRKLREEIAEAEKVHLKVNVNSNWNAAGEKENKKEAEKKRKDRRKEKDKASSYSSRSNSDGEEIEKRMGREYEKKMEFDKKSEIERQKALVESFKAQVLEAHNKKAAPGRTKYFDRVKGNFFSNARSLNGATSFFGRNTKSNINVSKVGKPNGGAVNYAQNLRSVKKDSHSHGNMIGKSAARKDSHPIVATAPKKSWHQLFRSSSVSPDPDTNNNAVEKVNVTDQSAPPNYSVDDRLNFGMLSNSSVIESMLPSEKELIHNTSVEEAELFEDPCYIPDPQFDNFPFDLGTGFLESREVEVPLGLKTVIAPAEVSKPSPIESPLSRLRISEERHMSCTPKPQNNSVQSSQPDNGGSLGTWHMWGSPLARDGIDLAGGPTSWFHPLVHSNSIEDDKFDPKLPTIVTPQRVLNPIGDDPWVSCNSPFQLQSQVDGGIHLLPSNFLDNLVENEAMYSTPRSSATINPFEVPLANGWSNIDDAFDAKDELVFDDDDLTWGVAARASGVNEDIHVEELPCREVFQYLLQLFYVFMKKKLI